MHARRRVSSLALTHALSSARASTHTQDMKDVTNEVLYESWRRETVRL